MSLHIAHRQREGTIIVYLKGPSAIGQADLDFRDKGAMLNASGKHFDILGSVPHEDVADLKHLKPAGDLLE